MGCGAGQLASLIRDKGFKNYIGIDFSKVAIDIAIKVCPEFKFICEDILNSENLKKIDYDFVIILEVLEHVEEDKILLSKIKSGTKIIAMVPNFDSESHVRYFSSKKEVKDRYSHSFRTEPRITEWLSDLDNNTRYFVIEGIIK